MFQSLSEISTIFNNDVSVSQNMIQKLEKNENNHFRQEFRCKYLIQTCHSKCIFQSIWFVFPDVMLGRQDIINSPAGSFSLISLGYHDSNQTFETPSVFLLELAISELVIRKICLLKTAAGLHFFASSFRVTKWWVRILNCDFSLKNTEKRN